MKAKALLCGVILFFLSTSAQAQEWSRYVPEKQRKDISKKATKLTTSVSRTALVIWVTEPVARVIVSNVIDRERIDNQEAEKLYQSFRSESHYTFMLATLSPPNLPGSTRASNAGDPIIRREIFLQRSENNKVFTKGEAPTHNFDFATHGYIGGFQQAQDIVVFPKTTRENQPLIQSLDDKIEIQLNLAGKKVILEYKLKELISRLEDL